MPGVRIDKMEAIIQMAIAIIGIIITAGVAIYSIRKTAEENRVSSVHNEMIKCVIDSIVIMRTTRDLLRGVANKATYHRLPENEIIETAYTRYWRDIQKLSSDFNKIQAKQKFVFPKNLYNKMQELVDKINEARNEAKRYNPETNNFKPRNNSLSEIVKEIDTIYVEFVNDARRYVGVSALSPISVENEKLLAVEDSVEP